MQDLDRRSALAFGITTVSTLVLPHAAEAGMSGMSGSSAISGAAEGKEIGPGVRRIVCHMLEGELTINQGPGMDFVAKKGDVWTCNWSFQSWWG
jgi:hypothetical protein